MTSFPRSAWVEFCCMVACHVLLSLYRSVNMILRHSCCLLLAYRDIVLEMDVAIISGLQNNFWESSGQVLWHITVCFKPSLSLSSAFFSLGGNFKLLQMTESSLCCGSESPVLLKEAFAHSAILGELYWAPELLYLLEKALSSFLGLWNLSVSSGQMWRAYLSVLRLEIGTVLPDYQLRGSIPWVLPTLNKSC